MELAERYDIVIIGAGMGGSALAYALRHTSARILIVERGSHIKQEAANWDPDEVIANKRYDPTEHWVDDEGRPFKPRIYYNVGGSSKFFGGSSFRFREADFRSKRYPEGETVPWPIGYEELAPYYDEAEKAMWVHGKVGADPTEPPRGAYAFPPVENEGPIAWLQQRLEKQGLKPFPLPVAIDQGPDGRCRKGSPCDGFPCKIRAKGDGENSFLRPAKRAKKDIELVTEAQVHRLEHDERGSRIVAAEIEHQGQRHRVEARHFVLAAGAVNSAALLLRSKSEAHPRGLANGSGLVGQNFMAHNNTVLMAITPFRKNTTWFQKTMALNDFYFPPDGGADGPSGNIQMRGKVLPQNLAKSPHGLVRLFRRFLAGRTFDFWIMSEDLPSSNNRVEIEPGNTIRLRRRLNNLLPHRRLVQTFRRYLRRCGFALFIERAPSPGTIQHQVGTLRMGADPSSSVVNADGRSHEVENLWVADGSLFPSSAAVNPALTIAANALRIGGGLKRELEASGEERAAADAGTE
jgi:choline dehydrogenase-like flavoprotein